MNKKFTPRKRNRLEKHDYSSPGAYFITICTDKHKYLFWQENNGNQLTSDHISNLSEYGQIVDKAINDIPIYYPFVSVDKYVVIPNHIHILLRIHTDEEGRPMVAPTISTIVQQTKGIVSKQIGHSVWQKLYYDHVIRNNNDYDEIWNYIDKNPQKWKEDKFFNR